MSYVFPYLSAHQSRDAAPTDWELTLADALEAVFAGGAHELPDVVAGLNGSRVRPHQGGAWTAENFSALMHELGGGR